MGDRAALICNFKNLKILKIPKFIKMKPRSQFTELRGQNFLEVKYGSKNYDALSSEEAHNRYNKNIRFLSKIFTVDDTKPIKVGNQEPKEDSPNMEQITKEMEEENEQLDQHMMEKLQNLMAFNQNYHQKMDKMPPKKGADLSNFKDVNDKDCVLPHPFLMKGSPFYQNCSQEMMLEVKNPKKGDRPFDDFSALDLLVLDKTPKIM